MRDSNMRELDGQPCGKTRVGSAVFGALVPVERVGRYSW